MEEQFKKFLVGLGQNALNSLVQYDGGKNIVEHVLRDSIDYTINQIPTHIQTQQLTKQIRKELKVKKRVVCFHGPNAAFDNLDQEEQERIMKNEF